MGGGAPTYRGLTTCGGDSETRKETALTKWMTKWQGIDDWTRTLFVRLREDSGQALAEYGLILAFVFAAAVLALTALGLALAGNFEAIEALFP